MILANLHLHLCLVEIIYMLLHVFLFVVSIEMTKTHIYTYAYIHFDDDERTNMWHFVSPLEQDLYDNLIAVRQLAHEKRDYSTVHVIEEEMLQEQTTVLKYMHDLVQRLQRNEKNSMIVLLMMDQDVRRKQLKKPSSRRMDFICFSCSKNILHNQYEINGRSQWKDTQIRKSPNSVRVYVWKEMMLNDLVLSDIASRRRLKRRKKDMDVSICHWYRQLSYAWLEWNYGKRSETSDDRFECWLIEEEKQISSLYPTK